jgi:thioesterase domain-containing protein
MSYMADREKKFDVRPPQVASETYVFPPSAAQKGFWVLDQLQQGNPACNIAVRFRLRGPLDPSLLEKCVNEIVRRHESLRTRLSLRGTELVQIVEPRLAIGVQIHDLRHWRDEKRNAEAERLTLDEAQKSFDPGVLPLIRVSALRLEDEEHTLLLTIHHAVSDGWSIGLFAEELTALYDSGIDATEPRLSELPVQYADYAIWQRQRIDSGALDGQLAYWRDNLARASKLSLPTDFPRGSAQLFESEIRSILLDRELTGSLGELGRRSGCTLFVVTLAAFQVLLNSISGITDVVIGTLDAGRASEDVEHLIGAFVNSLVLRTDLSGDPSFTDLLQRTNETLIQAFQNRDVPFDLVVKEVNPTRVDNSHPLFQINMIYQRDFVRPVRFGGMELTPIPSRPSGSPYDINLFLVERADGWRASIEYARHLFRDDTVSGLLRRYERILEHAAKEPGRRISALASDPATVPVEPEPEPLATDFELKIKAIWESVLESGTIGLHDNFFEVGGHSMLAAALLVKIQKECGTTLRLAEFLKTPTVAQMAAAITDGTDSGGRGILVPIQEGGSRPPLFLVHGVGGTVVGLGLLATHIGKDQPLYGVQSPPLDPSNPPPSTIEQMAQQYVGEILKIQPEGPIFLLGYSLGGLIAFEMAQQLTARNHRVGMLGMLDTFQLGYWRKISSRMPLRLRLLSSFRVLKVHMQHLVGGPRRLHYIADRVRSKYISLLYRFHADRGLPSNLGDADHLNWFAARRYTAKPYSGSLILFRAIDRDEKDEYDYLLGWGGLARGGIEVFDIPGRHEDMGREPNIAALAKTVDFCIRKSEAVSRLSIGLSAKAS